MTNQYNNVNVNAGMLRSTHSLVAYKAIDLDQYYRVFLTSGKLVRTYWGGLLKKGNLMQFSHKHCMGEYECYLTTELCTNELYRGIIVFMKIGVPCALLDQSVTISTPSAFRSIIAAEIEASAYAHELVASQAIKGFFRSNTMQLTRLPL